MPESRLLVSKWDPTSPQVMPLITFLDRRATERRAHFELGAPMAFTGLLPANDPEINIVHNDNFATSGYFEKSDLPFVSEGVRLVHWLRREHPAPDPPWTCRGAGPLLLTEDSSDPDIPRTRFTFFDPWAYLFARPCLRCVLSASDPQLCQTSGGLVVVDPIPKGPVVFAAGTEIQFIVGELLRRTIAAHGPVMIDAGDGSSASGDGNDYGGTSFWEGTINNCGVLTVDWVIQDGTSVGEAWQQLHETGLIKIILNPIYDPANRPGYCAELNIFRTDTINNGLFDRQGSEITAYPNFDWDRTGHDISDMLRTTDGTERANKLQFLGPQGYRAGIVTSTQSVTRYGQYWAQEQFNRLTRNDQINIQAQKQVYMREQGRRLWQIAPVPEMTYQPFRDYDLAYFAGIYHSRRFREDFFPFGLITAFDIDLSDDGTETVTGLLIDVDESQDALAL